MNSTTINFLKVRSLPTCTYICHRPGPKRSVLKTDLFEKKEYLIFLCRPVAATLPGSQEALSKCLLNEEMGSEKEESQFYSAIRRKFQVNFEFATVTKVQFIGKTSIPFSVNVTVHPLNHHPSSRILPNPIYTLEFIPWDTEHSSDFPGVVIMIEFTNLRFVLYFSTQIKTNWNSQKAQDLPQSASLLLS